MNYDISKSKQAYFCCSTICMDLTCPTICNTRGPVSAASDQCQQHRTSVSSSGPVSAASDKSELQGCYTLETRSFSLQSWSILSGCCSSTKHCWQTTYVASLTRGHLVARQYVGVLTRDFLRSLVLHVAAVNMAMVIGVRPFDQYGNGPSKQQYVHGLPVTSQWSCAIFHGHRSSCMRGRLLSMAIS